MALVQELTQGQQTALERIAEVTDAETHAEIVYQDSNATQQEAVTLQCALKTGSAIIGAHAL